MHHEVQFGEGIDVRRTWTDWGLFAMQQPTFTPPAVKRKVIDLPGGNGEIDLTEAVSGYPAYANREGTWNFLLVEGSRNFLPVYNQIMQFLHGQAMRVRLPDDDPGWYYDGRFWVDSMACDRLHGVIAISYSVGPFKWADRLTTEPWLWDPFSFVDGVIGNGYWLDPDPTYSFTQPVTENYVQLDYWRELMGYSRMLPSFTAQGEDVILSYTPHGQGPAFLLALATIAAGTSGTVEGLTMDDGYWIYNNSAIDIYARTESGHADLTADFHAEYQGGQAWTGIPVDTTEKYLNSYPDGETEEPHTGLWPRSAAGAAPVQVTFTAVGTAVTLTVRNGADLSAVTTQTLLDGTPAEVPGLVLYRGGWLYDGRPSRVTVQTASGTATLDMQYREGRL